MLKGLVKIANRLDSLGLTKEADILDRFIRKVAAEGEVASAIAAESSEPSLLMPQRGSYDKSMAPADRNFLAVNTEEHLKKIADMTPYERWKYLTRVHPEYYPYITSIEMARRVRTHPTYKDSLSKEAWGLLSKIRTDLKIESENESEFEAQYEKEIIGDDPEFLYSEAYLKSLPKEKREEIHERLYPKKEKIRIGKLFADEIKKGYFPVDLQNFLAVCSEDNLKKIMDMEPFERWKYIFKELPEGFASYIMRADTQKAFGGFISLESNNLLKKIRQEVRNADFDQQKTGVSFREQYDDEIAATREREESEVRSRESEELRKQQEELLNSIKSDVEREKILKEEKKKKDNEDKKFEAMYGAGNRWYDKWTKIENVPEKVKKFLELKDTEEVIRIANMMSDLDVMHVVEAISSDDKLYRDFIGLGRKFVYDFMERLRRINVTSLSKEILPHQELARLLKKKNPEIYGRLLPDDIGPDKWVEADKRGVGIYDLPKSEYQVESFGEPISGNLPRLIKDMVTADSAEFNINNYFALQCLPVATGTNELNFIWILQKVFTERPLAVEFARRKERRYKAEIKKAGINRLPYEEGDAVVLSGTQLLRWLESNKPVAISDDIEFNLIGTPDDEDPFETDQSVFDEMRMGELPEQSELESSSDSSLRSEIAAAGR